MKYRGKKKYQVGGLTQSILDRMNQYNSGRTGDIQNLAPKPYKQIEKIIPKPKQPKETFVGPAPVLNYGEQKAREKYRAKKLQEFVDKNPEYKLNEFGEPTMSPYGIFIQKYGDNLDKFAGSMETPLAIQGAGDLLYGVGKLGAKYLPQVGEYLTTQTPLKNTYKYNPWAFKPNSEAYYRRIGGDEGLDDLLTSGEVRASQIHHTKNLQGINLAKAHTEPYFSVGVPFDTRYGPKNQFYKGPYTLELKNHPMTGKVNGKLSRKANIGVPLEPVYLDNPNLKIYKEDWLKGYKEVPKPVSKEQGGNITMNYRGKKCMKCGGKPKMQLAGEVECPPGLKKNPQTGMCEVDIPENDTQYFQTGFTKDATGQNQANAYNPNEATPEEAEKAEQFTTTNPTLEKEAKAPTKPNLDPYWLFRGFRNGMSWLSGKVERGRQNRYDWMQQTALGQMNPMPTDDFQPNPYNLYMQKGGNLKTIIKDYNKYTNDAQMDMGDGKLDDKGRMQKGGRAPIYTDNPNDPRLRAYNDSLNLYNSGQRMEADYQSLKSRRPEIAKKEHRYKYGQNPALDKEFTGKIKPIEILHNDYLHPGRKNDGETDYQWISGNFKKPVQPIVYQKPQGQTLKNVNAKNNSYTDSLTLSKTTSYLPVKGSDAYAQKEIDDIIKNGRLYGSDIFDDPKVRAAAKRISKTGNEYDVKPMWTKVGDKYMQTFKKPVGTPEPQEPEFKAPNRIPTNRADLSQLPAPNIAAPDLQQAVYDNTKPTNYSYTYPTGKYNEQKVIYFPDENLLRNFADKQATTSIQSTGNQATATGTLKMKKGGYEIDKMMIMGNILPKLLQMGRLGTSKYRRMKEGGLTANKAREILHDGTVHGKKLTDKQRRYFGAMSKGHTNFRGK